MDSSTKRKADEHASEGDGAKSRRRVEDDEDEDEDGTGQETDSSDQSLGKRRLRIKLDVTDDERSLIEFEYDGTTIEININDTVNDLSDRLETDFLRDSVVQNPDKPLVLSIVTIDSQWHRDKGLIILHDKAIGEVFDEMAEIIVLAEVSPADEVEMSDEVSDDQKIPVTVITGFLGSGKTTLLKHILTEQHGRRIAVLENEFGETSIDDQLIRQKLTAAEHIVVADNGCLCCTVRGDLVKMIGEVLDRNATVDDDSKIEAIMIETTGMADPSPVLQTFYASQRVVDTCKVDGVITVVDARNVLQHLNSDAESVGATVNESVQQIAFADRIILNKMDLVNSSKVREVMSAIRGINKVAKVLPSTNSRVNINAIVDIGAFDLTKVADDIDPEFREECKTHRHDQRVSSVGIVVEGEIDGQALDGWWESLMETKSKSIYRSKGILAIRGSPFKMVFQAVHELLRFENIDPWKDGEARVNKMVFIGTDLDKDALRSGFAALVEPTTQDAAGPKDAEAVEGASKGSAAGKP